MNEHEKMEFRSGLGRLYDETPALRMVAQIQQEAAQKLQTACEALRETALAHEKRPDRVEVVQQWLAEKERNREQEGRH